jgi:hypothetical protein
MIWMLNIDVAIGAMRSALNPLSCAIEVYDYQKLIRLRVFDPDNTILVLLTLSMRDIVDPLILRSELKQARARVGSKGFSLRSWTAPGWQTYKPRLSIAVDRRSPCRYRRGHAISGADIENI